MSNTFNNDFYELLPFCKGFKKQGDRKQMYWHALIITNFFVACRCKVWRIFWNGQEAKL